MRKGLTPRIYCLIVALLLSMTVSISTGAESRYDAVFDVSSDAGRLTMRFIWLGPTVAKDKPGDCTILISPDGKVMVLDAGHPESAQYVIDALDKMGITRIDYLVASHPHIDHIGSFPALMRRYEIGTVYTSALTYETSSYYRAYMDTMAELNLTHVILQEGDSFTFGDEIDVKVYNPVPEIPYYEGYPEGGTQFINNQSLVLRFTYGETSLLFAGDLYVAGEKAVLERYPTELDSDFVKANHHGSATSSSKSWRDAVSPQLAVILSDVIEDVTVTRNYNKNGSKMYHILLDGCIRVAVDNQKGFEVLTEKDRTTTMFD